MLRDHGDGFEKEALFHDILAEALSHNPNIKARTIKMIIGRVTPDFMKNLFEHRPCKRTLRYAQCACYPPEPECICSLDDFTRGKLYESTAFSGGTYILNNDQGVEQTLGYAYFDWVE